MVKQQPSQVQGKISILSPAKLEVAEVTADAGVARTGPSTDYSRLTPLPKGTRASVTGREGEWLRLDYGGWIKASEVRILAGAVPPRSLIRSIRSRQVDAATEVIFPLQVPVPVSVQQGDRSFTLTLYNTTAQTDIIRLNDDPVISRLDWQQVAPGSGAIYLLTSNQPNNGAITLDTKGRVWSYHYVIHQKPLQSKIQNPGRFLLRRKPPEPSAPKSKIQNPYLESKFFLIQAMVVLKVARRDQRAIQKKMSL
jgi:hypothetical protein